ncbi:MAG: beta-ketoacyl-[acyl-carrier-protein] synthase family protein [Pseudomonadota bacterium]
MQRNNEERRVVVTGMSINTAIGDNLETFYENLLAGKSAITRWKFIDTANIHSKVGGDLSEYDFQARETALAEQLPGDKHKRLRKLARKAPFSTHISLLTAADAYVDAGLNGSLDPTKAGVIVGGHNLHNNLLFNNIAQFNVEPEYINSLLSLHGLDTDVAASISEVLGLNGPVYTVGGACASTKIALRNAIDEIRHHDQDVILVSGAPLDFSPIDLHAMAIMGAISYQSFNDLPEQASRPYDMAREGFIPSHGSAVLVVEELRHALERGAHIYAEVLGVSAASDGCHLPAPSKDGQARTMRNLLEKCGVAPEEVDYINAHATSTPLGDRTEIGSIKEVFGDHAYKLKVNATKSMLGHTCWAAPVVETVAALLQMNHGTLHPSINIVDLDPQVDLDVCANAAVKHEVNCLMKNSFGFGGINCCALYKKYDS